jgi:pentatricopeptide repeat protein
VTATPLRLYLLGAPDLRTATASAVGSVLQQPKRLALLAWLAGPPARASCSRAALLALFWPSHDEPRGRNALSQALFHLRRSLGDGVIATGGVDELAIDRQRLWCDAVAFDAATAAGRDEEALELYRGEFMQGFSLAGAGPDLEQWLDTERERLRGRALAAAWRLATAAQAADSTAAAVRWAYRAAVIAPDDEETAARLVELLAQHDDVAAARAAADTFTRRLRHELELEPSPDIEARIERALADHRRGSPSHAGAQHSAANARQRIAGDVARPTRLIVLPFRILRSDPGTDFLAFGLADAITTSLAGLQSLVVRSQTAALQYAGRAPDIREIGRDAAVDVVLTGTLLRDGARLRVTCELTDANDGTLLWAEHADVGMADLFTLQDQLTVRIVESIAPPLSARERQRIRHDVPAAPDAYTHYLRANELAMVAGRWEDARDEYLESLRLDARYAPAWARLGRCYRLLAKFRPGGEAENNALAEEAFRMALRLNPELPTAVGLYAQLEVDLGRAPAAMVRLLWRARTTGGDPDLFAALVHACRFCGLLDLSVAAHERARRLDPQVVTSVGHTFWMIGDAERTLQHTAGDIGYLPGLALATLGRSNEALDVLRAGQARLGEPRARAFLTSLAAILEGKTGDARAALAATRDYPDGEGLFYAARSYARLGDHDDAMDLLERAVQRGFCCDTVLAADHWLQPLRATPRFTAVLDSASRRRTYAAEDWARAGGEQVLQALPPNGQR